MRKDVGYFQIFQKNGGIGVALVKGYSTGRVTGGGGIARGDSLGRRGDSSMWIDWG